MPHDLARLHLSREIHLPGLEQRHHEVEPGELINHRTNAGCARFLRGGKVEPHVSIHHLALEPLDEGTLLAGDFDADRLRSVLLHQTKEVVDRLIHRLTLADAINPEPITLGIIGPNTDY